MKSLSEIVAERNFSSTRERGGRGAGSKIPILGKKKKFSEGGRKKHREREMKKNGISLLGKDRTFQCRSREN